MVASFCAGCVSGCKGGLERTARERGLPLVITGTGEPQLRFGDLFLRVPRGRKGKLSVLLGFAWQLTRNPSYLAIPRCLFEFAREGYFRMGRRYKSQDRGGVRFVSAYDMVEWDETRILETIRSELGWRNPSFSKTTWRSDCRMHIVKQYMYLNLLGWTKNDMILSGLVRQGAITREEALRRVEQENELPEEMVAETLADLGVDFGRLRLSLSLTWPALPLSAQIPSPLALPGCINNAQTEQQVRAGRGGKGAGGQGQLCKRLLHNPGAST
jgi:hypothetical protein